MPINRGTTAWRYAAAIAIVQVGWIGLLLVPEPFNFVGFFTFAAVELLIPAWAESAEPTTWHHDHIAERYGLFTTIVLGEIILSITIAIEAALNAGHDKIELALMAVAGLVTVFSMWWLYFDQPRSEPRRTSLVAFLWGYGHVLLFGSLAATGAGLAVAIDHEVGTAQVSAQTTALRWQYQLQSTC